MTAIRRTIRSAFALVCLALAFTPATGSAQYMYLDSNGNGIHDAGDRLRGCPTRIDVWLNTSTNRDASLATCGFGAGALNMSHYEFALQVLGGTVTWGPMSNLIPNFDRNLARDSRDTTGVSAYHNGWSSLSSGAALPPGLYHLATLEATPATGNPRIEIVARHPNNGTGRSSFGSECPATPQFDHTNRFGVSWADVDGLVEALPVDTPPLAVAPGIVLPMDGSAVSFQVSADDVDIDPIQTLSFDFSALPPGNDAAFVVSGLNTPAATGTFTWNPTTADSGDYSVSFTAGNCLQSVVRNTILHVIGTPTSVENSPPARDFLSANYPNPFHPRTEIGYSLAREGMVRISVFSASGRRVRTLLHETAPAGPHRVSWDGTDDAGQPVASGIYWYRLETGSFRMARRMLLLR